MALQILEITVLYSRTLTWMTFCGSAMQGVAEEEKEEKEENAEKRREKLDVCLGRHSGPGSPSPSPKQPSLDYQDRPAERLS
jgi:hypothetical protein